MKKAQSEFERYVRMNAEELAKATAEFDQEFIAEKAVPLTPEMAERWERAKRKPGRPRRGRGARVISLSVERGLLRECDALARKLGIRRSVLIDRSLRATLARMRLPRAATRKAAPHR